MNLASTSGSVGCVALIGHILKEKRGTTRSINKIIDWAAYLVKPMHQCCIACAKYLWIAKTEIDEDCLKQYQLGMIGGGFDANHRTVSTQLMSKEDESIFVHSWNRHDNYVCSCCRSNNVQIRFHHEGDESLFRWRCRGGC